MYSPALWKTEVPAWPALLELVHASASGAPTNLSANDVIAQFEGGSPATASVPPPLSLPAIACADSLVAPGTNNLTDIFNAIVHSARNVSHMGACACLVSRLAGWGR